MANDIVVRVGAVLDRSFDVVMGEVEKKTERAQRASTRSGGGGAGGGDVYGPGRREFAKAIAYNERLQAASERKQIAEHERAERQRTVSTVREASRRAAAEAALQRQRSAALMSQYRSEERAAEISERKMARTRMMESSRANREIDRFATRTSHRATRFFFPPPEGALGTMKRIGLDVARGAGVDFSLSGGIAKARERQSAAVALSNQGWNPDAQSFESRISAAELRKVAKEQAARLGLKGEEEVMGAMTKFTDVTGDLETAKAVIGDIGLMARASGTDLEAAASAAADISAQLPDELKGVERQKTMSMLMNVAAMQGKRGAVEVKDLARYVPRIAAQAGAFGAPADQTIVQLLAATQIARRYGGAGNAAQAATATAAMVNTLKTPARVGAFRSAFKKAGMTGEHADIYDAKTGQLRAIPDIIKDSIVAASVSKDPQIAFKKMWGNVMGAKGPEGFRNVFMKAGGGKAGLEAIDAEFKKFTAALDPEAQKKMLAEVANTTEATANRFQQKLDETTEKLGNNLMPALEKLAPVVLQIAEKFSSLVTWAAGNPFQAVVLAMTASVARAGIESGIRAILDRAAVSMLGGGAGGVGGAGGAGPAGAFAGKGLLGGTATALALVAVGVAAYETTTALLKLADASRRADEQARVKTMNELELEGAKKINEAENPLARQTAFSEAQQKIIEADNKLTGNTLPGAGNVSPEAKRAIAKLKEEYESRNLRGTEQQRNAQELAGAGVGFSAGKGQGISSDSIAHAMVQVLTGAPINVRINNFDDMPTMTSASGGDSTGSVWRDLSGVGG